MSRGSVCILLSAAGLAAATATSAMAQAPATAQVWDVQFIVDSSGPFAAGDTATAVGITMVARVGILPNTSATGTNNFGVSRVGGGSGTFFATFADPAGGPFISSAAPGPTGEALLDSNGNPLAGHFRPFRGGFAPQGTGGSNGDSANGIYGNNIAGNATVTSIVGTRSLGYDGTPLGAATFDGGGALVGDYAQVYRFLFIPKVAPGRNITLGIQGLSARYLHTVNGEFATAAAAVNLGNQTIQFRVPTPGAAALLGLGGLAALRRRRV